MRKDYPPMGQNNMTSGHFNKNAETAPGSNLAEKISRRLDPHRDKISGKVLCAGLPDACAEHLARLLPDASIVCLTEAPVNRAAGTPGSLHEPLFLNAGITEYEGGLFDTVICLHEIPLADRAGDPGFPKWERGTFYLRRAQLLMDHYEKEIHTVCRHLKPDGHLFSFVRSQHDEYFLGWCLALAAEGMAVDPGSARQILCRENGSQTVLQSVVCAAGGRTQISLLLAGHLNFLLDRMNTGAEELHGRGAEILLQADTASLLRGYHVYQGDLFLGKLAVYASAQRPDVIYYFTDVAGDEPWLRRFHEQDKDKVIRHMVGELHRQRAVDKSVHWKELQLNDDWSETEL